MRWPVLAAVASLCLAPAVQAGTSSPTPRFSLHVSRIDRRLAREMDGVSWHPGCPVPLADLRLLRLSYIGFDHQAHTGQLIVNKDASAAVGRVFAELFRARFPIRRMELVDRYGGSDFASIEADNTSAFNCRNVAGTTHRSQHAYGRAIDINPIENPYVTAAGTTAHRAGRPYLDRSLHRPGMAFEGGVLVRAFDSVGWGWGGRWSGDRDYQHFSSTGS